MKKKYQISLKIACITSDSINPIVIVWNFVEVISFFKNAFITGKSMSEAPIFASTNPQ
jgi:hypothetical protein